MAGIFKAYDIRGTYPDQLDETTAFRVGYHFRDLLDEEDLALGPVVVVSRRWWSCLGTCGRTRCRWRAP